MKIAQVAPLSERIPPHTYGGTERVVHYLVEELVARGHEVTLYASGDSQTSATLVPIVGRALRLDGCRDLIAPHLMLVDRLFVDAREFDVVHFHIAPFHFPLAIREPHVGVTTLHGRLDIRELAASFYPFRNLPFVSISRAQQRPMPWLAWQRNVPHGLPLNLYRPGSGKGGYLAFVGRVSPEKGLHRAIEIASRAGLRLLIAAKVDDADLGYFTDQVRPLLRQPHVDFLGELGDGDKERLLGDALALLFPVNWPEPFGMVMIESLACGTPVIAWNCGSVPEVIEPGITGYIVSTIGEAVAAVDRVSDLDRTQCRRQFEERFSSDRMARDYTRVYERLVNLRSYHAESSDDRSSRASLRSSQP